MSGVSQQAIFGPVFAMVLLTFAVWGVLFYRRVGFLRRSGITPEELAVPGRLAEVSPPQVSNPSDNFKNLFEVPVLFYVLALALYASGQVDGLQLAAAWVFVAFRVAHSAVHCTVNVVMLRFYLYLVSTLAVAFMAVRAAWALL